MILPSTKYDQTWIWTNSSLKQKCKGKTPKNLQTSFSIFLSSMAKSLSLFSSKKTTSNQHFFLSSPHGQFWLLFVLENPKIYINPWMSIIPKVYTNPLQFIDSMKVYNSIKIHEKLNWIAQFECLLILTTDCRVNYLDSKCGVVIQKDSLRILMVRIFEIRKFMFIVHPTVSFCQILLVFNFK